VTTPIIYDYYTHFGTSVAISGDGKTSVIGANEAVYVMTRTNTMIGWTLQTNFTLLNGYEALGSSVALSYDGNTLAMGVNTTAKVYTVLVSTRNTHGVWSDPIPLQGDPGENHVSGLHYGAPNAGFALAVSPDGTLITYGRPYSVGFAGSVWVFTLNDTTGNWSQFGPNLGPPQDDFYLYGYSLSLAGNHTMIVGAPYQNSAIGMVFVHRYSTSSGWATNSSLKGNTGDEYFGLSVAISSDATTVAIVSYSTRVAVYNITNTSFVQLNSWAVPSQHIAQACGLTFSPDGQRLIMGGPGAVWQYAVVNKTWIAFGNWLGPTVSVFNGLAVTMTADTLIAGDAYFDDYDGGVWSFDCDNTQFTCDVLTQPYQTIQANQGSSLAFSEDCSTLVVGGFVQGSPPTPAGTWVFNKNDSGDWNQYGLTSLTENSGHAVAVSSDGKTVVSSWPNYHNNDGALEYFLRNSSQQWDQPTGPIYGTGSYNRDQGYSLSMNGAGTMFVVGGPYSYEGQAWVFVRNNSNFEVCAKIDNYVTEYDQYEYTDVGYVAAITNDTSTIGVIIDDTTKGLTFLYLLERVVNTTCNWTHTQTIVVDAPGDGPNFAFSTDGNTLVYASKNARTFTRTALSHKWNETIEAINTTDSAFGHSISINKDGTLMAIGATDLVLVYKRHNTAWELIQVLPTASTPVVALCQDGKTLAIGNPTVNSNVGQTTLYTLDVPTPAPTSDANRTTVVMSISLVLFVSLLLLM
jgi:hypothetical protein